MGQNGIKGKKKIKIKKSLIVAWNQKAHSVSEPGGKVQYTATWSQHFWFSTAKQHRPTKKFTALKSTNKDKARSVLVHVYVKTNRRVTIEELSLTLGFHVERTYAHMSACHSEKTRRKLSYLSMITGSEGVSFRLPQLFLSQHRLTWRRREKKHLKWGGTSYQWTEKQQKRKKKKERN